jgi:hypothetical protein
MHGHRRPRLYREKILARPAPILSSAESFHHLALYILAEREGGNEPSHIKKEVCEALKKQESPLPQTCRFRVQA